MKGHHLKRDLHARLSLANSYSFLRLISTPFQANYSYLPKPVYPFSYTHTSAFQSNHARLLGLYLPSF